MGAFRTILVKQEKAGAKPCLHDPAPAIYHIWLSHLVARSHILYSHILCYHILSYHILCYCILCSRTFFYLIAIFKSMVAFYRKYSFALFMRSDASWSGTRGYPLHHAFRLPLQG